MPDPTLTEEEGRHHTYVGAEIPWYVHLLWLAFWIFAIYYVLRYLFPTVAQELPSPP
jgi:hypothetical protein